MTIDLSRATLSQVAAPVRTPGYDVGRVRPGIVHLGLGGFHRAHMARYTHALMERQADALAFGIIGAGLRPGDRGLLDSLAAQDGLYSLIERSGANEDVAVIGSLAGLIYAGDDSGALLDAIADPRIRIVSLTVTENGYCLDPATKVLDPAHPMIRRDLADPMRPTSAIGVVTEGLRRRREGGHAPFTALSCDNIQHNGHVLRDAVLALARLRDPALADWIEGAVAFPSTMVDRITPVTAPGDIAHLADRYGLRDRAPVVCEAFTQWVIEDRFPGGRPAWEDVSAQFVPDVAPYEAMKLRLLNASHLAVAGLGRLAGLTYIHETMQDPPLRAYMAALMERETGPTLPPVPGIDLAQYRRTLIDRFANSAIQDTVERVNTDAPLNVLMDPIRARLADDQPIELLALALAAWLRRMRGVDEAGLPIDVRHPQAALLRERTRDGGPDPAPALAIESLFGDLGHDPRLLGPTRRWLTALHEHGSRATLERAREALAF
ncbi:MAG: mannitol dehydrogenase family protein [Gemmatimonadaceae bacterium]|nr:mannitol dehydrogenase family protein [Acetobacteraceae bacterium]